MKALVEDTFTQTNGQKTVFITHSMGSPMTLYFLNHQTQDWKNKYIKTWISLAGCWGGTIKALKVFAQGVCLSCKFNGLFHILYMRSFALQEITLECEF